MRERNKEREIEGDRIRACTKIYKWYHVHCIYFKEVLKSMCSTIKKLEMLVACC